jgi:hypothetical protein
MEEAISITTPTNPISNLPADLVSGQAVAASIIPFLIIL